MDSKKNRGLAAIQLDVRGGDIIVDLPGTNYTVTYHKPGVSPQLLANYLPVKDGPRTELTQAEFLARAWRLANDKARELGWIAQIITQQASYRDFRPELRESRWPTKPKSQTACGSCDSADKRSLSSSSASF